MKNNEIYSDVRTRCDTLVYHGVMVPCVSKLTYNIWLMVAARIKCETPTSQVLVAIHNEERNTNKPNDSTTK